MKIAMPCNGNEIAEHFGRCEKYFIFEIENSEIKSKAEIPHPGHEQYLIPRMLSEKGTDILICKDLGPLAIKTLNDLNIKIIAGVSGNVDDAISKYLSGNLEEGESDCNHFE